MRQKSRNGKALDVHHIIPRRFSEIELHSDPENLITLCTKHHRQAERSLLQSIPLLQHILSIKYGYNYPYIDADIEYIRIRVSEYARAQSKIDIDWVSKYPAVFIPS